MTWKVFETLKHGPPLGAWQIGEILKMHPYLVRPSLTNLKGMGKIRTCGKRWIPQTQRNESLWTLADAQLGLFDR